MDNTRKKQINNTDQSRNLPISSQKDPQNGTDANKSLSTALGGKNFEKYEIIVDNEQLESEMRMIEWRSKTELPLVKVLFYKILQKKLLNQCSVVQVAIQNFTHTLYTLPRIGFYQILYLLKQALIGFQQLYDRFGSFEVSQKMVLINKSCKCRVWLNENITLNFPGRRSQHSQNQFLVKILHLFEEKCMRSIMVIDLFQKMGSCQKMQLAIHYLEAYLKANRIVLPTRLLINTENIAQNQVKMSKTPSKMEDRVENEFNAKKNQSFGGSQVKKIPKFILNLREERKQETSIDMKSDLSKSKYQIKRNTSQIKIMNKSHSRQDLLKQPNLSYINKSSNNSPISNISQASFKEKSGNLQILSRTSIRNIVKQGSQEYINPFMPLGSKKMPQAPSSAIQKRNIVKQQPYPRAYQESSPYLRVPYMDNRCLQANSAKDLSSVNCSQQTATTINESILNETESRTSFEPQQMTEPEEASIFQKNGWMRRVNNLTQEEFCKEMAQSHHQGIEVFSESYALAGENLALLGTMGKEVKSSLCE